jgi:hypothetical protein
MTERQSLPASVAAIVAAMHGKTFDVVPAEAPGKRAMVESEIQMPLSVAVDGRTWRLFSVEYGTVDGHFSTYIYALSDEHAAAIVAELRQTARCGGAVVGWVKA